MWKREETCEIAPPVSMQCKYKHKQGGEHASRAARHCRKLDLPLPFEPSRPYRRPIVSSMEQSCIRVQFALRTGNSCTAMLHTRTSHTSSTLEAKGDTHVAPCWQAQGTLQARTHRNAARACISSTPLSPMLKPSILISRLVGRDVSTPVTVRVLAAATAAADCSTWPFAGASARLAKLTSLCRSACIRFNKHGLARRSAAERVDAANSSAWPPTSVSPGPPLLQGIAQASDRQEVIQVLADALPPLPQAVSGGTRFGLAPRTRYA